MTSRSMRKMQRFCTSLYILGTRGNVAGFKYEWKVKGECILTHYSKNYFLFNTFSVKPDVWHENWHFLENHPNTHFTILFDWFIIGDTLFTIEMVVCTKNNEPFEDSPTLFRNFQLTTTSKLCETKTKYLTRS